MYCTFFTKLFFFHIIIITFTINWEKNVQERYMCGSVCIEQISKNKRMKNVNNPNRCRHTLHNISIQTNFLKRKIKKNKRLHLFLFSHTYFVLIGITQVQKSSFCFVFIYFLNYYYYYCYYNTYMFFFFFLETFVSNFTSRVIIFIIMVYYVFCFYDEKRA